jgi:Transposase
MPNHSRVVIGGVDTHGRTHHAAVLDEQGRLLGDREFAADRGGYRQLLSWLGQHGQVGGVGVEAPAASTSQMANGRARAVVAGSGKAAADIGAGCWRRVSSLSVNSANEVVLLALLRRRAFVDTAHEA